MASKKHLLWIICIFNKILFEVFPREIFVGSQICKNFCDGEFESPYKSLSEALINIQSKRNESLVFEIILIDSETRAFGKEDEKNNYPLTLEGLVIEIRPQNSSIAKINLFEETRFHLLIKSGNLSIKNIFFLGKIMTEQLLNWPLDSEAKNKAFLVIQASGNMNIRILNCTIQGSFLYEFNNKNMT